MKNIFFDLGGVLFNLNTHLALHRFAELGMNILSDILNQTGPFNASPTGHPIYQLIHKVDLGVILGTEFLEIIRSQCRYDVTTEQILEAYNGLIEVPLSRLQLLDDLSRRYNLFLVSNIGDLHWQAACEAAQKHGYSLPDMFCRCFLSYEMHLAKPDIAYFETAIRLSGVEPSETLYIDDSLANIAAGAKVGLQAYHIEANTLESHVSKLF